MRVVESFQDSGGGVNMTQGVTRASLNPVLGCVIPLGSERWRNQPKMAQQNINPIKKKDN